VITVHTHPTIGSARRAFSTLDLTNAVSNQWISFFPFIRLHPHSPTRENRTSQPTFSAREPQRRSQIGRLPWPPADLLTSVPPCSPALRCSPAPRSLCSLPRSRPRPPHHLLKPSMDHRGPLPKTASVRTHGHRARSKFVEQEKFRFIFLLADLFSPSV
jgi:hypothetical protein